MATLTIPRPALIPSLEPESQRNLDVISPAHHSYLNPLLPVGNEGSSFLGDAQTSAALAFNPVTRIWFVEYCEICGEEQVFISGGLGLVACCVKCKDAKTLLEA